ncbi:MAG: hypothetical protein QGM50_09155 [Anaerolineae bacterium]|nr:hypothetical protein [Anaerolineae bacterium]MDK1118942.1 hypothetical protein [Anaerolineae bacterium]
MPKNAIYEDSQIKIFELLGSGDTKRIEAMMRLYRQLFPEYAHYTKRMEKRTAFPPERRSGQIAHYWLVEQNNKPIGFTTFRYLHKRKCAIGVAFGIETEARKQNIHDQRLSTFVTSEVMGQLERDSELLGAPDFWGLVTEVEHRDLMEHYKRTGMIELPIKYYEPIFPVESNGKSPQDRLEAVEFKVAILGIIPNPKVSIRNYVNNVLRDFALAFLVDHYGLPEDHEIVNSVTNSII